METILQIGQDQDPDRVLVQDLVQEPVVDEDPVRHHTAETIVHQTVLLPIDDTAVVEVVRHREGDISQIL